jgi:hypothetical protein
VEKRVEKREEGERGGDEREIICPRCRRYRGRGVCQSCEVRKEERKDESVVE